MSMFNDVGVWCMHFSGSVKQYVCHKRLLGVYQCLSECVSVSNMLPRDICQYLIGLGCEGRVSKRRRIFSLTLWLFSRWQILAGCLATNTLYRTVTSGWHVPETSITFESICASIENLDFKCAKVRTRKLPDKIPHSHKPQPRIIRMELHALLPHKHLVARSLLRPASMSEPEPPMLRRSLTPPASGPHRGPVYPRLPLNPEGSNCGTSQIFSLAVSREPFICSRLPLTSTFPFLLHVWNWPWERLYKVTHISSSPP